MYNDIEKNIALIRERIAAAAGAAGRSVGDVKLIAATKTVSAERVRAAIRAGVDACGENRVQELVAKRAENAYDGAPLHFIGHLQKNKVNQVVGVADLIESVDSKQLLLLIDERASSLGIVQDILIEVNIGGEESKTGICESELDELLELACSLTGVRLRGLMSIPPEYTEFSANIKYFQRMYQLYVDIRAKKDNNTHIDILSMGMSGDYELAVSAGATCVRVGSAIFGERSAEK